MDRRDFLTEKTSPVQTASASDVTMASLGFQLAARIYCCGAGTLGIKRAADTAFVSYPVSAGQYIDGQILAVGGTSDGTSSGMQWIAEV
jgi:hypothetical protein